MKNIVKTIIFIIIVSGVAFVLSYCFFIVKLI